MCQLTIVNLNKKDLNLIADYLLSFEPSKHHSDGYGLMYQGKFDKTVHAPIKLVDFGSFANDIVKSNLPIYSHIRDASYGIEVCEENSHPFESDNFLLMHNGTLTKAGEKRAYQKDKDKESDSKLFLDKLEDEFKKDKKFVESFNRTMEQFWGKFAFLIYAKKENQYYICRGTSADLFKANLLNEKEEPIGYIINTSKLNIETVTKMISNISQIIHKEPLAFSDPELLEPNCIFEANTKDVIKVAETKENVEKDFIKEPTAIQQVRSGISRVWPPFGERDNDYYDDFSYDIDSSMYKIVQYMLKHYLSPKDMALIFKLYVGGADILCATREELTLFADNILKELKPQGGISTLRFIKNNFSRVGTFPVILYSEYGLDYPWMVNDQQDVVRAVKKYQKDQEKNLRKAIH